MTRDREEMLQMFTALGMDLVEVEGSRGRCSHRGVRSLSARDG
jgi:hypothetical protein